MNYRDKNWLYKKYVKEGRTLKQIAEECGTSFSTIHYQLKKHGIERPKKQRIFGDKKKCDDCLELLPLSEFHIKKQSSDGYWHWCNKCYQERYKDTRREYRNRPEVKDKMNNTASKWQVENRKQQNKNAAKWWSRNKDRIDIRIHNSIQSQINVSLKGKKQGRSWETLVGYTCDQLICHLEDQFEDWMSWDNYGKVSNDNKTWQIDHIRPVSSFNITSTDCEDFKKCWSLDNLRPLDSRENVSKGSKY